MTEPPLRQYSTGSSEGVALAKIRPELNLEKWFVWQPSKSKTQPRARVIEREITSPTGDKITGKLRIGYTDRGPLTTEDQKTYYALVKHWEEQGRPGDYIPFSLRSISRLLEKRWGTNVIDSLTESLMRLRGTLLVWENSYYDNTTKETAELIETFNIIADLKIIRRKVDGVVNREVGYFRFNEMTMRNVQTNHTKPVLFDVVLAFKSEIAQVLYTHIDLILAGNTFHERRTKELFDDLGITGSAYQRRPSKRKKVLEAALSELQGVPLSKGGIIASATIEETKDRKDFKVVFRKGFKSFNAEVDHAPADRVSVTAVPLPAPVLSEAVTQANDLIRYFHKLFFRVETSLAQPRHRDLATALVGQYGIELAKYIVEFSYREAQRTHFRIATFGGIMQYVARALAEHELVTKKRQLQQELAAGELARDRDANAAKNSRRRAEQRYRQLSDGEREALTAAYRHRLIEREPSWGRPNEYGQIPFLNVAIKSAIINDFIREERRNEGEDTGEEMISSASA